MNQPSHRIIVVAGPTAVGKTEVALEVATRLKVPIVSFDSRQCYQELNIGVARPRSEQLDQVPHYFIADHSIHQPVSAAYFERFASQKVAALIAQHGQVVMVGGTGLYWKAFWEGLDEMPVADPSIRTAIREQFRELGVEWLQSTLRMADPLFANKGEMRNPQRMMRALEVMQATGKSILSYQKGLVKPSSYGVVGIGLQLPRPVLNERIHRRVEMMMQEGLLDEARSLQSHQELTALRTVGYTELFDFLERHISLDQAVEQIKVNTRQYAKRQMTWFTKDPLFSWYSPGQLSEILALL